MAGVQQERVERRLTAILAADVAGYSRLMGQDEEGTLAAVKFVFSSLLNPKIEQHRGRVAKTMGDGLLAEFASAVDAMRCAIDIQRALAERNAPMPADRRIELRIGVNVGDIIFDRDDIFGDGVNIAARIQTLAEPGTICLSETTYQQVEGKIDVELTSLGEQTLKNIARPIRVYATQLAGGARPKRDLPLPDKPSIAVLPFANLSGDPEQEYFADGMVEDIITALSQFKWLFVIARNSSFTYKGKNADVKQIARELGVRYVLEGSVRKGGNKVRITGQLIDGSNGAHIWAEHFDGAIEDIFDLQDRVTGSVIGAIEPTLEAAEMERVKRKPPTNMDAYDLLLRAWQQMHEWTEESFAAALRCLDQALAIDPAYAPAMGAAAHIYALQAMQGWSKDLAGEAARGISLASRAAEIGKDDSKVLWMAASGYWLLAADWQSARDLVYRSLRLNQNAAWAWTCAGWIETTAGEPAKGMECFFRAGRLSPRDPRGWAMMPGVAFAHFLEGRFDKAVGWAQRALVQRPRLAPALAILSASLAAMEQKDKAAEAMHQLLKLDPQTTIAELRGRSMYIEPRSWDKYAAALRLAGLPE